MSKGNWQTIDDPKRAEWTAQASAVGLLVFLAVVVVIARAVLLGLDGQATVAATPALLVARATLAASATPSLPVATPTHPTRTPIPTATPQALRLAVEQSSYAAYASYFEGLPGRMEGLTVVTYTRHSDVDNALAGRVAVALYWAPQRPSVEAILVREEPYAAVVNQAVQREGWTLAQLAAIAGGKDQTYTFVTTDQGQVLRELLGVEDSGPNLLLAATWAEVKELVATQPDHIGLIPWDAVDFRVRVLPVEGRSLDPAQFADYPLLRRLWVDSQEPLPAALLDDLHTALHYEAVPTVSLVAVGDVMLSSYVGETISATSPRYPFEGQGVQPLLAGADIAFGNLECAISEQGERQDKTYTFRADPTVIEGLRYAGFDVLSLANNHTGDYGDEALLDTLDGVRAEGMLAVGAGRTITEAHTAQVVTVHGLRIAFLAYNQILPASFEATATSPGSAFARAEAMTEDVHAARERADLVVVSCHWGVEYSAYPDGTQKALAQALADAGADLVIGHHPHVVQGLAFFPDTFVAYSLGNFVFYDMITPETSETVILRCLLDSSGVKTVELTPVTIQAGQPVLAADDTGAKTTERIWRITAEQKALPAPVS